MRLFKNIFHLFRRFRQSYFWHNKFIFFTWWGGLVINLIGWILIWLFKGRGAEFVPLHYNVYFGVDIIGQWTELFKIPGIALIFLIVNYFLAYYLFKKEKIISFILVGAAGIIQVFSLIALIFILTL